MAGFARIATQEKLLLSIAEKIKKPVLIFDWHGLGSSEGDFGDLTVERLLTDLKRMIGAMKEKGFSKFHLVGHSFAACVIAMAINDPIINAGKRVLLAPALNQRFLLRYWFAKEKGYDFNINSWAAYSNLRMKAHARTDPAFDGLWKHEEEFLSECGKARLIKGIAIRPDYWQTESCMDYSGYFPSDHMRKQITCNQTLCIHGGHDSSIPVEVIEGSFESFVQIGQTDHFFTGAEDKVATIVSEFIG